MIVLNRITKILGEMNSEFCTAAQMTGKTTAAEIAAELLPIVEREIANGELLNADLIEGIVSERLYDRKKGKMFVTPIGDGKIALALNDTYNAGYYTASISDVSHGLECGDPLLDQTFKALQDHRIIEMLNQSRKIVVSLAWSLTFDNRSCVAVADTCIEYL